MRHTLHYSLELPLPQKDVFAFFADVANLQQLTPPELNFTILTPLPVEMKTGATIDFSLSLFGVPFKWKTEILVWQPPHMFVDRQIEGPYGEWRHQHTFRPAGEGKTVIDDDIIYSLPSQPWGEFAYPLVNRQLEKIFSYRQKTILHLLSSYPA